MGRGGGRSRAASSAGAVVAVLAGSVALGATASCGLFGDPLLDVVTGITGGECFTGAPDGGFDLTTEVPCTQAHAWEVMGTVPLPADYADADYDDVVSDGGRLRDDVFRAAMRECVPQVAQWSGVAGALEGVEPFGPDALVWPGFAGRVLISTTPEAVWEDTRTLLCVIEWRDVQGRSMPVRSATTAPAIASFATDAPPEQRVCRVYDLVGRLNQASCSAPHDAEYLFTYDASVHGADWVAGVDPADVTVEEWVVLDGACRAAAPAVFGVDRAQPDLAVIADVRPELWGGGPFGPDTYSVACMVLPSNPDMLLDGPVWGLGNEPARLVVGDG